MPMPDAAASGALRVLHVSDTHLAPGAPYTAENWEAVLRYAAAASPDWVVHTGDLSLDGANRAVDLEHARRQLDRLGFPWMAVPGNHDVGDLHPSADPIDDARRARYRSVFGENAWAVEAGGWQLVGVDAQTLVSTLPAADELWAWLAATLTGNAPAALFLHRPLGPLDPADDDHPERYVTEPARARLTSLLDAGDARLVASGHVHQWRTGRLGGRAHVWAPSAWALVPDSVQPVIGTKVIGAVLHHLARDGTVTSELVIPDGIAQVTIGTDFPSPYEPHPGR